MFILFMFFFFKQKTAYEMRISDWSSDVCSSDLSSADSAARVRILVAIDCMRSRARTSAPRPDPSCAQSAPVGGKLSVRRWTRPVRKSCALSVSCRSEEHTSELQSLMRHSYAVFCLKTKNKTDPQR